VICMPAFFDFVANVCWSCVADTAQSTHIAVVHSLCANVFQLACETSRYDLVLQPAAMLSLQQLATSAACTHARVHGTACTTWQSCHAALSRFTTEDPVCSGRPRLSEGRRSHVDANANVAMDQEPSCAATNRTREVQISPYLSLLLPCGKDSCSCGKHVSPERLTWTSIAFDFPVPARPQ